MRATEEISMGAFRTAIDLLLFVPREIDRRISGSGIEQARQAVLANERRREPLPGGLDLEMGKLVSTGGPVHRHVRSG